MKTLTLQLDDDVASDLECVARALGVPVETVALDALRVVKERINHPTREWRLEALVVLQKSLDITPEKAAAWMSTIDEQRF